MIDSIVKQINKPSFQKTCLGDVNEVETVQHAVNKPVIHFSHCVLSFVATSACFELVASSGWAAFPFAGAASGFSMVQLCLRGFKKILSRK
jgi:hypothetical protein